MTLNTYHARQTDRQRAVLSCFPFLHRASTTQECRESCDATVRILMPRGAFRRRPARDHRTTPQHL